MGQCYGKHGDEGDGEDSSEERHKVQVTRTPKHGSWNNGNPGSSHNGGASPMRARTSFGSSHPSPRHPSGSPLPHYASSPAPSTPGRSTFKKPFPPPSPAKHIQSSLVKRHGAKPKEGGVIPAEVADGETSLDKHFHFPKNFNSKYELGHEVGRGHFGHTCYAKMRKGEHKGQAVAVKIISKAKMTTAIAIEDVRREVRILKALTGHHNLVRFYDACEDNVNVYIVMEGGKYSEEDAKIVLRQILSVVAFCHLQGVVHRDLKPENFLFTTKDEHAQLKAIDFGLSDFIKPDERLNDIVGSAYYVAPEVLHRSYSMEADVWSVGVITYILLCGSRPFWARTESGIFRAVLRADPSFEEAPWPSVSAESKDFVKRLLNKDMRKRMTAAQALTHPWIRSSSVKIPLDTLVYRLVRNYLRGTSMRKAALKALSKTLTEDETFFLHTQFMLLEPNKSGRVTFENFRQALLKNSTEAMKESRVFEVLISMDGLNFKKMDFSEFCAAAISVHHLEATDRWDQRARAAYDIFEKEGNRVINYDELAKEMKLPPTVPAQLFLDWIRQSDGRLSFTGFTKLLHGISSRAIRNYQH
nr:CDPK-related protein kinase-like isoform X2 [Physcomitrium patens]|eukprot:XP_024366455.1 CDPK-related protein kinase-like isoform X2 [Physcomitrella patens]